MSKFTEYLEATKSNKTAGIPAIKEHLKYIERYIDKANQTPGVLQSLEDIKKRMMKTSIARPEGHVTKKQIALNEAKAKLISEEIEKIINSKSYDYWNKTLKLALTKKDFLKIERSLYDNNREAIADDYGLDGDWSSKNENEANKRTKDQMSGKDKYYNLLYDDIFRSAIENKLKISDENNSDDGIEIINLEVALKAYKTITGKEYKK